MPVGKETLGRIFNVIGQAIDNSERASNVITLPVLGPGEVEELLSAVFGNVLGRDVRAKLGQAQCHRVTIGALVVSLAVAVMGLVR